MTQEIIEKFRKCKVNKTYYVEGYGNDTPSGDVEKYWYLFNCNSISNDRVAGDDIYDHKNKNSLDWFMELKPTHPAHMSVIQILEEMSIEKFKDFKPEYFL